MKKNIVLTIVWAFVCSAFIGISAQAASGDVAGNIYSTDIKACINGVWVDSYNIGGKTVVIVEDITNQFKYADKNRTLSITDLNPEFLISGSKAYNEKTGTPVGKIYETNIKTYFRGKELTCYSLDGKMAVEIEELGADNELSSIGGKYIWDADKRTISLEIMYRYSSELHDILREKTLNMVINGEGDVLTAEFVPVAITNGSILGEGVRPDNSITPVTYGSEVIGYLGKFPEMELVSDENGERILVPREAQQRVDYYYIDRIAELIADAEPVVPTAKEWLTYYEQNMYSIKQKLETDDYLFLYMSLTTMHGAAQYLTKIDKNSGEQIYYNGEFESVSLYGQMLFENVDIDEENEKVYLHYDCDYVIDLKTDEIKAFNNLTTDIGVGTDSGQPTEYNCASARNAQFEYKLIADDEEMIVKGFSIPEFYYANMLPLAETFDFLNIKYSFENDILTIDTSEAKSFSYEITENKADIFGEYPINYLFVDKVMLNGEESSITYQYISGHFQNTHYARTEAKPYVCNGKVYINDSFIALLCEKK